VNITAFKVLLGKIRGGAAAQNIVSHSYTILIVKLHCKIYYVFLQYSSYAARCGVYRMKKRVESG
jgi:hypothetical protein